MDNLQTNHNNLSDINDNPLKCLICNKEYKHLSGLCKHNKIKHINYDEDVKKMFNKHTEDVILTQLKALLLE